MVVDIERIFIVIITEAEVTWQYVLQDRKKRRSSNSVTAYCERIAKAYSKNPPTLPKPPQKMRLLDRVKVKQVPERPPPLPPLVPNIVSVGYPALPMPGENGVKQHCKIVDIKIVDDNVVDDHVGGKNERPKWTGIEDIVLAYSEYSKGTTRRDDHGIYILSFALTEAFSFLPFPVYFLPFQRKQWKRKF